MKTANELKNNDAFALEEIIDRSSVASVLRSIETICNAKAEHIRENWQDEPLAKEWEKVASIIGLQADNCIV